MARTDLVEASSAARSLDFGGDRSGSGMMKRKTPSELREEQLKRKKSEFLRTKKYIDTRVSEVYPIKKSSERCRLSNGKEKAKEILADDNILNEPIFPSTDCGFPRKEISQAAWYLFYISKTEMPHIDNNLTNILGIDCSLILILLSFLCDKIGKLNSFEFSNPFAKDIGDQGSLMIEKYNQHNVAELHLGKKLSDSPKIDMEKALKGLVPRHSSVASAKSSGKHTDFPPISGNLYSEFCIKGNKPPLDLTLKTNLRLVSSSSVRWCHRLNASIGCKSGLNSTNEVLYSKALRSWVYPQSSLPSSIITAMALTSTTADFLQRRQHDWEISFQNLYYMLRKNLCGIFYVYTSQFVVLFVGGNFSGKKKWSCNAYISKSTRGLRTLLRKHEISFTMPLRLAESEQAIDDDFAELSEIEKQKLGQTFHLDSMSDMDNSHQSLLAFIGNENVHSLYDFLLNYRCFLPSLTSVDVPALYAPVTFQNASLCVPEVRCKEMKRADFLLSSSGSGSDTDGSASSAGSRPNICYSIEIKDVLLPPWVVSGLCVAMGLDGRTFVVSFTADPASISLNVALDSACKSSPESGDAFGVCEAVVDPRLQSASLRQLKYSNGCYVANVNRI